MPLSRVQKETKVTKAQKNLSEATAVVFMAYDALPVPESEELRDAAQAAGVRVQVLPKRLLRLALQRANIAFDPVVTAGQVAMVWGADAVSPAKIVHTFAKGRDHIRLLAGTLEGTLLSLEQVQSLAALPSREQLLGQLVGTLVGPVRGFQYVLTGAQRQMVGVLAAIAEAKGKA